MGTQCTPLEQWEQRLRRGRMQTKAHGTVGSWLSESYILLSCLTAQHDTRTCPFLRHLCPAHLHPRVPMLLPCVGPIEEGDIQHHNGAHNVPARARVCAHCTVGTLVFPSKKPRILVLSQNTIPGSKSTASGRKRSRPLGAPGEVYVCLAHPTPGRQARP